MRTIYLDGDFKCHVTAAPDRVAAQTDFFGDRCDGFIEGYRFVPAGESWVRADGSVFRGEMIAPWKDYDQLRQLQLEHEKQQLEALLEELYEQVVTA